jgi:probable DNA metabolism protein
MVYIFDGTMQGFLTAFPRAYTDENALLTSKQAQLPLGEEVCTVTTNPTLAQKVSERLTSFDRDAMSDLDTLLRSGMPDNEQIAFRYFHLLATVKRPVGKRLATPEVFAAVTCMKRVGLEIHRLHGFVRFMETASGALYAPITPDNDICDLLLPHFRARLTNYPFVLHDIRRKKAVVYDGKNAFNAYLPHADVVISADEQAWQCLWKEYYQSVNIPSRERLKQMRAELPVRYRTHLPELQIQPIGFSDE